MPDAPVSKKLRVLFVARAFPPQIGGIERQNFELYTALSETCETGLIVNRRGRTFLPIFFFAALFRLAFMIRRYDVVLLGDATLGILAWLIGIFSNKPVACIVHGLDITWPNPLYQRLWPRFFLTRADRLIAVGNETIRQGSMRGLAEEKFIFVPNGVNVPATLPERTRAGLEQYLGTPIAGKKLLLTVGRLVRRKGIAWFVRHILAELDEDTLYIVAGDGPERQAILDAAKQAGVQQRLVLTGVVNEAQKELLYRAADLFVQPNIEVEGDIEGFGLVVLEAAATGMAVIASDLQGLKDAVCDGQNGLLVEPGNTSAWVNRMRACLADEADCKALGVRAREYVAQHFTWQQIAADYLGILEALHKERCS
ncbi:MAG: glycosyltransferase family 4 protein [Gammaproteobacteria bacterium]